MAARYPEDTPILTATTGTTTTDTITLEEDAAPHVRTNATQETPPSPPQAPTPGPVWRNPISRRRISSEGTLEYINTHGAARHAGGAPCFTRRNYGDAYNRARLLHEFTTRRSLSDAGQRSAPSRGFIQDCLDEREREREKGGVVGGEEEREGAGGKRSESESVREERLEGDVTRDDGRLVSEPGVNTGTGEGSTNLQCGNGTSISKVGESSSNNELVNGGIEENREKGEESALGDATGKKDELSLEKEQEISLDTSIDLGPGSGVCADAEAPIGVVTVENEHIHDETTGTTQELAGDTCVDSPELEDLTRHATTNAPGNDLLKRKENSLDPTTIVATSETLAVQTVVQSKPASDSDFRTSSPWSSQAQTPDSFDPESLDVSPAPLQIHRTTPVYKRHNSPHTHDNTDHRASLPPNFFEHISPIPPPRRNSPRKRLDKSRAGRSLIRSPANGTGTDQSERPVEVTEPLFIATESTDHHAHGSETSLISPNKTSPKRRAPTPPKSSPRPHSIAYLERPKLALHAEESPIAPPRSKRRTRTKRQNSAPSSESSDIITPGSDAGNHGEDVKCNQASGEQRNEDSNMEAQQRKLELDQMRANLFGYQKQKAPGPRNDSEDSGETANANAIVVTLSGDDEVLCNEKHQSQVMVNMTSPTVSHPAGTTINISDKGSPERVHQGYKTNVRLDFNDDINDNSYSRMRAQRDNANKNAHERLDSLIHDGHKPYKTMVDLSATDVADVDNSPSDVAARTGSSPRSVASVNTSTSRIILDLDSHQFRPETTTTSSTDSSYVTAEEEFFLQGRPAMETSTNHTEVSSSSAVYKTDIYVSPQDRDTYESASNYGESESSTNLDVSSLAKSSEHGLSDDSDLSEGEGTFQATFEPGSHCVETIETRTCIKLGDDDGDSGITLVSYHSRSHSDSLEEESTSSSGNPGSNRGVSAHSPAPAIPKKTGVVLNLSPAGPSPPRVLLPPVRVPSTIPSPASSTTPRLIKMSRDPVPNHAPEYSPALKMEARSTAVMSGMEEIEMEKKTGQMLETSQSIGSGKQFEEHTTATGLSPPRTTPTALSPHRTTPTALSPHRTMPTALSPHRTTPTALSPPHTSPTALSPSRTSPTVFSPPHSKPTALSLPHTKSTAPSPPRTMPTPLSPHNTTPTALSPPRTTPTTISTHHTTPTALSPPRAKRPAPAPPPPPSISPATAPPSASPATPAPMDLQSAVIPALDSSLELVADNSFNQGDNGELSAVARTGTTVFHSSGSKFTPHQWDDDAVQPGEEDPSGEDPRGPDEGGWRHGTAGSSVSYTSGHGGNPVSSSAGSNNQRGTARTGSATGQLPSEDSNTTTTNTTSSTEEHTVTPHTHHHATSTSTINTGGPGARYHSPPDPPDLLQVQADAMDPITGLRKTGPVSAVDKAVKFVATTEPSFRVKKKDDLPAEEDGERATLIESMRVRRKQADWMPAFGGENNSTMNSENSPGGGKNKTNSELMYEQRKSKNEQNRKGSPGRGGLQPDVIPIYDPAQVPANPADIDASSINQETTKRLWEEQIASGEVTLFPRLPDTNWKRSISSQDVTNFKSEVSTESIGALNDVKKQWELKAEELAKEKADRERRISTSKSYESLSRLNSTGDMPTSKSFDSLSLKTQNPTNSIDKQRYGGHAIGEGDGEGDDGEEYDPYMYESAIDREVRLAEEREKALRREQLEARRPKAAAPCAPPPPPSEQLSEQVGEQVTGKETIIEREIKEQQRREEQLRTEGKLQVIIHTNKEHEQSEYERQEKEHERINAHESIVEREIRLQREREQEVLRMRSMVYRSPPGSDAGSVSSGASVTTPAATSGGLAWHEPSPRDVTEDVTDSVFVVTPAGAGHAAHSEVSSSPLPITVTKASKPPGMTSSISYEDAISTYAHTGESMIARELREQKEREEELRRRWRDEFGLESPFEPSEPDTPYNMPDPVQPRARPKSLYDSSDSALMMSAPSSLPAPAAAAQRKTSKVQPMSVSEDERDSYRYVPQYETPIEREIRLARDREDEFRAMKGLGVAPSTTTDRPVVLDMKGEMPQSRPHMLYRKGEEPVQEKATMQRLAHSRLQQEIELEKQRELDLLRLGHISTTSEERKGEAKARYVEIVPPLTSKDLSPSVPAALSSPSPTAVRTLTTPVLPPARTLSTPSTPTDLPDGQFGPRKSVRPVPAQRSMAEFKIEQELKEMREREEELKSQRELTSHRLVVSTDHAPALNGTSAPSPTTPNGGSEYQPPKPRPAPQALAPGDQLSKGPRRKTALAAEWERKFNGTS